MNWNEKCKTVVVSTAHLPYKLAQKMDNDAPWSDLAMVWEKTNYGYRIWTHSDTNTVPKKIRPIIRRAKKDGYRWVEFDRDAGEQKEFTTWEW